MTFKVINPATGQVADEYRAMDENDIQAGIDAAADAFRKWRQTDLSHRAALMRTIAGELESEKTGHAALMALEMGKPIGDGKAEIEKCAWLCRYYNVDGIEVVGEASDGAQAVEMARRPPATGRRCCGRLVF